MKKGFNPRPDMTRLMFSPLVVLDYSFIGSIKTPHFHKPALMLVFMAYASDEGSHRPVQICPLARSFAISTHNKVV